MWFWIGAAWLAAAWVGVVVHRRWRDRAMAADPLLAAFVLRLETELAERHPAVRFLGMLPDRFACLLEVDGQETVVALHGLHVHADADADAFTRAVARLIGEVRDVGLDRLDDADGDFAFAAPSLLPQVRTRAWLAEHGAFGDSGLVHRPLGERLVVVYVLDEGADMVFVCRGHLQRWRRSEAELYDLARANLASRGEPLPARVPAEGLVLRSGDGYDAARLLLLLGADEELLVAVPDRDTLWIGRTPDVDVAAVRATAAAVAAHAPHPVDGGLFRLTSGQLQPLPALR
jgi:hypothetical protein